MADPKAVLEFAKKNGAKLLDVRFTDIPGLWHHVSYPIEQFSEASFEDGFGMDGSSIRGWAAIGEAGKRGSGEAGPARFWIQAVNLERRAGSSERYSPHVRRPA